MKDKRREATIERIVETALRLLATEGFEALTIQRLARELGYAVGALYRYFRSKDALLVALLHRVMDRIGADIEAGLATLDEGTSAAGDEGDGASRSDAALLRLLVVSHAYVGFAEQHPAEYGLISTMIGDPREFLATEEAAPLVPSLIRLQLKLTSAIDEAFAAGALGPGEGRERGVILWSAMQGVLQLRKLGRFGVAGVELARLVPIALRTLMLGWGADGAQLDRLTPRALEIAASLQAAQAPQTQPETPPSEVGSSAEETTPDLATTEVDDDRSPAP